MSSVDVKKVGNAISYLRKRAGLTQKELSDRLGISDKAVSKWERGISLPDITYFGKLAMILDTDSESLLAGDVIHHDIGWQGLLVLSKSDKVYAGTIIYDKPLVYFLLAYFLLVGIKKITIICDEKSEVFIKNDLGDGSRIGINFCFLVSGAEDILRMITQMECDNVMVVHGMFLLYGVNQTRIFQRIMANRDRITFLSAVSNNELCGIRFDDRKRVLEEGSIDCVSTQYVYKALPILFTPKEFLNVIISRNDVVEGDAGVVNITLSGLNHDIYTEPLDRGYIERKVKSIEDVFELSGFIRFTQKESGLMISCIEEIALRRGLIGKEEIICAIDKHQNSEYGEYLRTLL